MSEWISVKDRLPEPEVKEVLVWDKEESSVCPCNSFGGWKRLLSFKYISHWMPLPEPPK